MPIPVAPKTTAHGFIQPLPHFLHFEATKVGCFSTLYILLILCQRKTLYAATYVVRLCSCGGPWCLLLWASLPGFFFSHLVLFFFPFSPPVISSAMSLALAENPLSFIIHVRLHHIVGSEVTQGQLFGFCIWHSSMQSCRCFYCIVPTLIVSSRVLDNIHPQNVIFNVCHTIFTTPTLLNRLVMMALT